MMLDAKRTFDELIEQLARTARRSTRVRQPDLPAALQRRRRLPGVHRDREALRARRVGRVRRPGPGHARLCATRSTPLTRPARLTLPPGPPYPDVRLPVGLVGTGILGRGSSMVFCVLQRVTGVDLLCYLSVFFRSLGGMIDGFTERARRVGALLEDPATTLPDRERAAPRPGRGGDLLPPQAPRGRVDPAALGRAAGGGRRQVSARRWRSASLGRDRSSWRALAARDAANVKAPARRARRPADASFSSPNSPRTCTTSRASFRSLAHLFE